VGLLDQRANGTNVEQMLSGEPWHSSLPGHAAGDDQRTADLRWV
jgi:hypothetical protein